MTTSFGVVSESGARWQTKGLGAGEWSVVRWIQPVMLCEVAFTEWTEDGRIRHPSFQGLREDKEARSVRREKAAHVVGAPRIRETTDPDPAGNGNPHPRRLTSTSSVESRFSNFSHRTTVQS